MKKKHFYGPMQPGSALNQKRTSIFLFLGTDKKDFREDGN